MILFAGISFGLFAGFLVCLFTHPMFRQKLAPERRLRLLRTVFAILLGAGVAGLLLSLLGKDAVIGLVAGIFPGFIAGFIYREWDDRTRVRDLIDLPPGDRQVAIDAMTGKLDPEDPTSAAELKAMLDKVEGEKPDGA